MQLTSVLKAAHFGNLAKVHGIVVWKLSPFEQRAFPSFFSKTIPNTIRRIKSNVLYVGPPFIIGYLIYDFAERRHAELQRKDPKEFENDE